MHKLINRLKDYFPMVCVNEIPRIEKSILNGNIKIENRN